MVRAVVVATAAAVVVVMAVAVPAFGAVASLVDLDHTAAMVVVGVVARRIVGAVARERGRREGGARGE